MLTLFGSKCRCLYREKVATESTLLEPEISHFGWIQIALILFVRIFILTLLPYFNMFLKIPIFL